LLAHGFLMSAISHVHHVFSNCSTGWKLVHTQNVKLTKMKGYINFVHIILFITEIKVQSKHI
jgi:hypothetical protein